MMASPVALSTLTPATGIAKLQRGDQAAKAAAKPCITASARPSWAPAPRSSAPLTAQLAGSSARRSRVPPANVVVDATESGHAAAIIDGKQIAADIRQELSAEVQKIKAATGSVPGLAVVLVGSRKDSETYVRSKKKACEEVGIASFGTDLPEGISEEELLKVVADYNADPTVHGILVQLPLPPHINEKRILDAISIEKDVDGFHPTNIGRLAMRGREPTYVSCTPKGCIELLERSGVGIAGKVAVVIGRSNIVGIPAAMLLQVRLPHPLMQSLEALQR